MSIASVLASVPVKAGPLEQWEWLGLGFLLWVIVVSILVVRHERQTSSSR